MNGGYWAFMKKKWGISRKKTDHKKQVYLNLEI